MCIRVHPCPNEFLWLRRSRAVFICVHLCPIENFLLRLCRVVLVSVALLEGFFQDDAFQIMALREGEEDRVVGALASFLQDP